MKKIEAIVKVQKLDDVLEALEEIQVSGLTICEVKGIGHDTGVKEIYRGAEIDVKLLSRAKIEIVESDETKIKQIIDVILQSAKTNSSGDGRIFVYDIEDGYRIHNGEKLK